MRTLRLSYQPWNYKRGSAGKKFEHALKAHFEYDAVTFATGREALLALLQSFHLPTGSEVIVQGYTCVVVPNAIHAAGLTAVYADISEDSLNLTVESVEAVITEKTRVVICQHTFGISADAKALRALCDEKKIYFIEDCAHVLPDTDGPQEILRHSDFAFASFGRDKAISGITGGAALSRNQKVTLELRAMYTHAKDLSFWEIVKLLEYPARMRNIVRPLIGKGLAGPALKVLKALKLFTPILEPEEKEGTMTRTLHRMPNVCAELAMWQLSKLKQINDHRRKIAGIYLEHAKSVGWPMLESLATSRQPPAASTILPLQKFPMFLKNASHVRRELKKKNIHLDDGWTGCVVCPDDVDMSATGYLDGSDPHAESASKRILSLPTHPTMTEEQARELIEILDPLIHHA